MPRTRHGTTALLLLCLVIGPSLLADAPRPLKDATEKVLTGQLKRGTTAERIAAADELGARKARRQATLLMTVARADRDPRVRVAAARAVGQLKLRTTGRALARLIAGQPDPRVRQAMAIAAAGADAPGAAAVLAGGLRHKTDDTRARAASALADLFAASELARVRTTCARALTAAYLEEKRQLVRRTMLAALAVTWHGDAVKLMLHQAGRASDDRVRIRALDGLAMLLGGDRRTQTPAGVQRRQVEQTVVNLMASGDEDIAFAAIRCAGALRASSCERGLLAARAKDDLLLHATAAWALGELKSTRALPALLEQRKNGKSWVARAAAADGLIRIGGDAVLKGALGSAPGRKAKLLEIDPWLRLATGLADARLIAPMTALARHEDPHVRARVAWALRTLKDPTARAALERLTADSVPNVVVAAAMALAELGDPAGAPALRKAITHGDPSVRAAAAEGLGRLADPEGVGPLVAMATKEALPQLRAVAIGALGLYARRLRDASALEALVRGLAHEQRVVRAAAARACRRVEHVQTLGAWIAVAAKETDPFVSAVHLDQLHQATGAAGIVDLAGWAAWWTDQRKTFAFPKEKTRKSGSTGSFYEYLGRIGDTGVDLVFVFDVTGSMGSYLKQATTHIKDIARTLEAVAPSLRMGYIAFRDTIDTHFDLSFDRDALHRAVAKEMAAGGGDRPESIELGLETALAGMIWRERSRKVVIVIGDAPSHAEDRCEASAFLAATRGLVIHGLAADPLIPEFGKMADRSGGMLVDLSNPKGLKDEVLIVSLGAEWRSQVLELVGQLK